MSIAQTVLQLWRKLSVTPVLTVGKFVVNCRILNVNFLILYRELYAPLPQTIDKVDVTL